MTHDSSHMTYDAMKRLLLSMILNMKDCLEYKRSSGHRVESEETIRKQAEDDLLTFNSWPIFQAGAKIGFTYPGHESVIRTIEEIKQAVASGKRLYISSKVRRSHKHRSAPPIHKITCKYCGKESMAGSSRLKYCDKVDDRCKRLATLKRRQAKKEKENEMS